MAPYDDWNKVEDEEDDELQDTSYMDTKKDVILFCIDCSPSMQELYDDPIYENVQTCHLFAALDAAVQIQKKKIITGPNDSVGVLLFNTVSSTSVHIQQGSEIKKNTYLFQPISPLGAPTIQGLMQLLDSSRENPEELKETLPPLVDKCVPIGDLFTSCNWVIRDGAPKTASKRVFLITDEDDPHAGPGSKQLATSARTTLADLTQAGITVEPFFISTDAKPFDVHKFYSSVLQPNTLSEDEDDAEDPSVLPQSISISRIEDLLAQMRFHEVPKRAQFSIPLQLGNGFTIGVKGYGLVTQQTKGTYKYFVDLGDRMEVVFLRTSQVDEDREAENDKQKILFGMALGAPADDDDNSVAARRVVKVGQRPFYTSEEVRSFRTLDMKPIIKLLGFNDRSELAFEDNVKHSVFIYPDEMAYSGSKRTFSALLKSMVKKNKIGLVLALIRRNASPTFYAMLPQEERLEEAGWAEPAGFHLIPLPFADDIREAPLDKGHIAPEDLVEEARAWMDKLTLKNGSYPPDSYPNPALAFHNAQLQASAFNEQYDPDSFEDLTLPKYEMIHKRAGKLMKSWKVALANDESSTIIVPVATGSKRKADTTVDEAEIRSKHDSGQLSKLRVDQLKDFLRSKGASTSGVKATLVERVAEYLDAHQG
ncbi:dsb repair complex subunit [Moniliophthora roreri MCA 2997]|uniref:ATP-dependent DNA helicase II subunit 1 n=1 Tax=Moniliophthora roreri (strain MCA 2997) TaxID=1381753 RepID=V2X569_MONRO|nr:dsb repair complex subunit [Moniliophthora roreri MCA 2997]